MSNAQPFSRKIDSKFMKLFIYPFVRTLFEKRVVAQELKCPTSTLESRVRFPLVPYFMQYNNVYSCKIKLISPQTYFLSNSLFRYLLFVTYILIIKSASPIFAR